MLLYRVQAASIEILHLKCIVILTWVSKVQRIQIKQQQTGAKKKYRNDVCNTMDLYRF